MRTRQEIVNIVFPHLRQQGRVSVLYRNGSCAYRGEGGLKCAIGCLIPDESFNSEWNTRPLYDEDYGSLIMEAAGIGRHDKEFAKSVQRLHDNLPCDGSDYHESLENKIKLFCAIWSLNDPADLEQPPTSV